MLNQVSNESKPKTFAIVWDDDVDVSTNYDDFTVAWLDNRHNHTTEFYQIVDRLRDVVNHVEVFHSISSCLNYISSVKNKQIFLIIGGLFSEFDVYLLYDLPENVLVYSWRNENYVNWLKSNINIRGIFDEPTGLIEKINEDLATETLYGTSTRRFDVNQIRYKCFQLLIDVLRHMPAPRETAKENMIEHCKGNNKVEKSKIDDFREHYIAENAIFWYSRDSFFKKLFDKDLRTDDLNLILYFGFYIIDLYNQLYRLQEQKCKSLYHTVYRGQLLPRKELEKLKQKVGSFISNNSFLSTTYKEDVALTYAQNNFEDPLYESVLFEIDIGNESQNVHHPLADISEISHIDAEILLSLGTVFRIDIAAEPSDENDKIWYFHLTVCDKGREVQKLTDNFDVILLELTQILRRMSPDSDKVNNKLLERCRLYYANNPAELEKIDDFEKNYHADDAIRWYAKDSFLFRLLNTALRKNDINTILDFRFFIIDLHDQLTKVQTEYLRSLPVNATRLTLFRGQLMGSRELKQLQLSVGKYFD
ncbi:unnamed protein product [Didymodactylos carnosus]|uniref:Uncharacterized protein n=1 Tax=Didymodactylos carnosus TaxID=1234261 RepID=A0A814HMD4_9BILA|nr:unnamed protein product [Didymodactylos carnosus]CAF3782641.1 unnamed protein product [Didymodactylos carnosus]